MEPGQAGPCWSVGLYGLVLCFIGSHWGYVGIMEKKMETAIKGLERPQN